QVFDRFWRPSDVHFADRLGAGRSRLPPQELTQALTCSCGTLSPRSNEPMAFLIPATCHSFTSRYSLSASAARNDRLRPVLLASFSNRFFTSASTRKVNVVDVIVVRFLMWLIVYIIARMQENYNRANLDTEPNADGSSTSKAVVFWIGRQRDIRNR
ncbi:MAG: hypothetical protein QOG67_3602, partial [Verrucomicrobiota bacterium]